MLAGFGRCQGKVVNNNLVNGSVEEFSNRDAFCMDALGCCLVVLLDDSAVNIELLVLVSVNIIGYRKMVPAWRDGVLPGYSVDPCVGIALVSIEHKGAGFVYSALTVDADGCEGTVVDIGKDIIGNFYYIWVAVDIGTPLNSINNPFNCPVWENSYCFKERVPIIIIQR